MGSLELLLSLAPLVSGFVCPPSEQTAKTSALGEACGGTCDSVGVCAEGLHCVVMPQGTVSPMSFAIASFGLGGKDKVGVCKQKSGARELQFVAGGTRDVDDLDSDEIVAAAKQAMLMVTRMSNSLTPPTLKRIVSAQSQVVAGMKYTLTLEMTDGSRHRVVLVDQPWQKERYSMVSHELLG